MRGWFRRLVLGLLCAAVLAPAAMANPFQEVREKLAEDQAEMEQRVDEFWDDMEASQERAKAMKAESARRQRTFFTVTLSLMAAGLGVTAILLVRSRQRNRQAAAEGLRVPVSGGSRGTVPLFA